MGYTPFLISNFATGLDKEREPWLNPEDAWTELFDGFIWLGTLQKRDGYSGFANGVLSTYCESRMVHQVAPPAATTVPTSGAIDGANAIFTFALTTPVRRGTVVISGSNPVQTATDDGNGGFTGDINIMGTNTIDYTTGAVTITFTAPPVLLSSVTVTYDYHPDQPVMGVMNFYTDAENNRELIVASWSYVNRYNSSTDRLDDITETVYPIPGSRPRAHFWSWVNYPDNNDQNRLLFVNNQVAIQKYVSGATPQIEDYPVGIGSTTITAEAYNTGDAITNVYAHTLVNVPAVPFTITVTAGAQSVTDTATGNGTLVGNGTGTVDYDTGDMSVTFTAVVALDVPITVTYQYYSTFIDTCLQILNFKDRLILLRTTENGVVKPRRIRISGTGQKCDIFLPTAVGAGFIDIPDDTWIMGAAYNRDDLIIFTQRSTWVLKYTQNEVTPFVIDKMDESRGSDSPFGAITYLSRTMALSRRGLLVSDGYRLERMDQKLPEFCFDEVSNEDFDLCFANFLDEDRDVYTLYPESDQTEAKSTRMLITNFQEDTFAIFRIPMSCLGQFQISFSLTWDDLITEKGFPDWDALGDKFGTWESFAWGTADVVMIGGGHNGEVWKMNQSESEDNPVKIRDIQNLGPNQWQITTDYNNYVDGSSTLVYSPTASADYINFTAVDGMTNINGKQFPIDLIVTPHYVFNIDTTGVDVSGTFTPGQQGAFASRVITFEALTKQFNPYVDSDKKLRLGYCYFYINTTEGDLVDDDGNTLPSLLNVEVITNDRQFSSVPLKYTVDFSTNNGLYGEKRWYKLWPNQVGYFVTLRLLHKQAGTPLKIQALMLGMKGVGSIL